MTEKKFKVGDPVMMTRSYGKPFLTEVVKVGSKYAYIGRGARSGMTDQVDAVTGAEKGGFGRAFTMQEWAERKRIDEVTKELRAHGIGPIGSGRFKQSVDTLEQLLAVLQATEVQP